MLLPAKIPRRQSEAKTRDETRDFERTARERANPRGVGSMGEIPRAQRFPIQTTLRYRESGETAWREGETVNISRTGVLFRTQRMVAEQTPVEMSFELPVEIAHDSAAVIFCQGQIVRTIMPPASDQPSAVAARIFEYRFTRAAERSKLDRGREE